MVDCHMHMVLDGCWWKSALARHAQSVDEAWVRRTLQTYQKAGFTYLRDGGDRWGVGKKARELAPEYGIVYRTPYAPLCKEGHYGSFIGTVYRNLKEYATLVRNFRDSGADFIKIMISGLMNFDHCGVLSEDGLSRDEIQQLIHIAHSEGMAVMAHSNGPANTLAAAEAGVDSVEHGAYLNSETLHAMLQAGTVWVPTLSTVGNLRGKGRFDDHAVCAILDIALENVATFAAMDGLLAPGTDAGAWEVPHGCNSEYNLLKAALGENPDAILSPGIQKIQEKF